MDLKQNKQKKQNQTTINTLKSHLAKPGSYSDRPSPSTHLRYIPLMLPPPLPFADLKLPRLLPLLLFAALIDDVSMAEALVAPSPPAPVSAKPASPLPLRGGVTGLPSRELQLMEDVSTMLSPTMASSGGGSSTEICRCLRSVQNKQMGRLCRRPES